MPVMEGIEQKTPEWLCARVGLVTASRIGDIMARLKRKSKSGEAGEPTAKRAQYMKEIVYEILTGRAVDHYVTDAMDFGTEFEDLARESYELAHGIEVQPGGFWIHDEISKFGASPDGLIGENGLVEYKVPPAQHLDIVRTGEIPDKWQWQILAELDCTGRQWCDFVSFHPYMPKHLRRFEKRFERDETRIKEMQDEVCRFLLEVIEIIKSLEPK